jgi:hypothetical protein
VSPSYYKKEVRRFFKYKNHNKDMKKAVLFLIIVGIIIAILVIIYLPTNNPNETSEKQNKSANKTSPYFNEQTLKKEVCVVPDGPCLPLEDFYKEYKACCFKKPEFPDECDIISAYAAKVEDCSQLACENCVQGVHSCMEALYENRFSSPFNYCAECMFNISCKTGYVCKEARCVKQ